MHAPYADLCARAQELIRAGKAGEAAATLSDAVKNGVQNAEVLSLLGLAHRLLGNTSMAASALRAALELMPHNPDIRSNLALMVAASGAPAEARRLWQEVLACRPDHAEAPVGIQQLDDPTRHPGEELQLVNAQELGVTKVAATLARCHLILDEISQEISSDDERVFASLISPAAFVRRPAPKRPGLARQAGGA